MAGIAIKSSELVVRQIYAYTLPGVPDHDGWTKIGDTERDVEVRIGEQTKTAGLRPKLAWQMRAAFQTPPYEAFRDHAFHAYLKKLGIPRMTLDKDTEWFQITPEAAKNHFRDFTENHGQIEGAEESVASYKLRPEQEEAVTAAAAYFKSHLYGEFLWNAKPRFGKTLSSYDLAKRMGAHHILIVTNRPAIAHSWYEDYATFFGPSSGLLFVSNVEGVRDEKHVMSYAAFHEAIDRDEEEKIQGLIEFVSLQDLKGSKYFGGQYDKLAECSDQEVDGRRVGLDWDLLIIDEAHEGVDTLKTDTAFRHINRKATLHLSGTPFKALASEKFPEDAIYNWTYADEQAKKRDWDNSQAEENPYAKLPRLSLYTYKMADIVRSEVEEGASLEGERAEWAFDLNEFFLTNESGRFLHEADVDAFLDALATGEKFPFSTEKLRAELKHTFWFLNRVESARSLAKKLKVHPVFKDYTVVLAAGDGRLDDEAENAKAFDRVKEAIAKNDKTITLSVGQLTTGITIPEWTAVLMLANCASPALYMQAAFRAQNPCLFTDKMGNTYRKTDAYVFDFDPARTLTIFEKFANDLSEDTAGARGDEETRRAHVRELLNFFPVYGEGKGGEMVELDAESVLSIPRRIHAREVVDSGFLSNFLFANISGIFAAPREIIEAINSLEPLEARKALAPVDIDEDTAEDLGLDAEGNVDFSEEKAIGLAGELFGKKVYAAIGDRIEAEAEKLREKIDEEQEEGEASVEELRELFAKPVKETLVEKTKEQYGDTVRRSTQKRLEKTIETQTNAVIDGALGEHKIRQAMIADKAKKEIAAAQERGASMQEITAIEKREEQEKKESYRQLTEDIRAGLSDEKTLEQAAAAAVQTVEVEKRERAKAEIEGDIRDHLRGFSRTIPAFLMAYGEEDTCLANFDTIVPEEVFLELTREGAGGKGVTLELFRFMRDGGDYYERDEQGREIRDEAHKKHYPGHLFDETVFNDAVKEFINRRHALANYFDAEEKRDIFDYIPNQKTNQVFTPKKVVRDMVDRLEEENPGCFDDPNHTFADLYMKSGMYIAEIVRRLYQSPVLRLRYPEDGDRLRHIFAKQVYGCAPTEIIYRICRRYILGFTEDMPIEEDHIIRLDTLELAKEGKLTEGLEKAFFPKS